MTWINSKRYRGLFLTILKTSDSKMLILALVFDKSFLDHHPHMMEGAKQDKSDKQHCFMRQGSGRIGEQPHSDTVS